MLHFHERSVTPAELADEHRVARLVESGRDLVGLFAPRQRRQLAALLWLCGALAPAAATSRPPSRGNLARAAAPVVRRLCARLRLPLGATARRRAAHRPVRHLAVQRHGRPFRRHRRRAKLCRAMGHRALRAGQGCQLRHREKHRQGHRAHHRGRGNLFLVRGDHDEFPGQRPGKFAVDRHLPLHRHRAIAPRAGFRGPAHFAIVAAAAGIAAYVVFMATVDVPMYFGTGRPTL